MRETREKQTVLCPPGDIVAASVPELRSTIRSQLKEGAKELVVDLANVRMIDSAGIGLLAATHNTLRRSGGALVVRGASPEILELFAAMRLTQHFRMAAG